MKFVFSLTYSSSIQKIQASSISNKSGFSSYALCMRSALWDTTFSVIHSNKVWLLEGVIKMEILIYYNLHSTTPYAKISGTFSPSQPGSKNIYAETQGCS